MVATLSASAQDEDDLVNEIGISYGVVANSKESRSHKRGSR